MNGAYVKRMGGSLAYVSHLVVEVPKTREISEAKLRIVYAALVDATTLVQALRRNNDKEVLDHLHASHAESVKMVAPRVLDRG